MIARLEREFSYYLKSGNIKSIEVSKYAWNRLAEEYNLKLPDAMQYIGNDYNDGKFRCLFKGIEILVNEQLFDEEIVFYKE